MGVHLVDIWNLIEAFRESGLTTTDPRQEINSARLESLVGSIYFQLNKRVPAGQQIDVEWNTSLLVNWLLSAYDTKALGRVRVFSIKVALATLCSGRLVDKLRYLFSLISDGSTGLLVYHKFVDFLREVLQLPCSVYESPSFSFHSSLPASIFDKVLCPHHSFVVVMSNALHWKMASNSFKNPTSPHQAVKVNDFLDVLITDPGPPCLVWLPLLHRLINVEHIHHPVPCCGCNKPSFCGFCYRCQTCPNYQLCQDCFWHGRVSGSHTNQHQVKEYTSLVSFLYGC
ncbi:DTNA [Cordylochernes scorpioides]|uniref:DTNA n=1 Tax=Cordylochernes scorpioides TaxID=51811 RepID=A0ABY6KCH2_9ARAC|nr:DTNA [Cordylochernes scorpioides]